MFGGRKSKPGEGNEGGKRNRKGTELMNQVELIYLSSWHTCVYIILLERENFSQTYSF